MLSGILKMTNTTHDLIQRLADALTNAIRVIHNEDGTQHISTATPVLTEARAFLDQPEPEGLTDEEILDLSEGHCVSYTRPGGSVIYPYRGSAAYGTDVRDDVLSFARALIAADRARWGRTTTTTTKTP